jgi:hypothetical protein
MFLHVFYMFLHIFFIFFLKLYYNSMTYKIIIFIFFIILIFIINYNILEQIQVKEGFDVDFGRMNLVLGESGVYIKDAEITPRNTIKFSLSNGNTLETIKSIKGVKGNKGTDAIFITKKLITDNILTFTFSNGEELEIGSIVGDSVEAGTTAQPGVQGQRSRKIPKRYDSNPEEEYTKILSDGRIELLFENGRKLYSNSTTGVKGVKPDIEEASITSITAQTKRETDAEYKKRTCKLWYLENKKQEYLDIYKLFIGNSDSLEISGRTFDDIGDVIWYSEVQSNFFDLKYENVKKLNGRFSDIINYIDFINNNLKQQIKIINFQRNELAGSIPKNLSKFINVTSLKLQNNNLEGTIPKELGRLVNLTEFNISSNNNITGLIPNTFVDLINLEKIYSEITGLIDRHQVKFDTLGETQRFLKTLDILTYNSVKLGKGLLSLFRGLKADNFNGTKSSSHIKSDLNLNKNLIELGLEITEVPQNMLNDNSLSWEELEAHQFIAIFSRIQMRYDYNKGNSNFFIYNAQNGISAPYMGAFRNMRIEGNIASLFSVIDEHNLNEKIKFINMSHNNLGGSIPDSITKLTNLTYLNLSHNSQISGQLPELGQITNLKFLLLNNTRISGILPESLKTLQNLVMINTKDTSLYYTYQKVKIPESYSYQEITEYNDLSTKKAEIKEFLKLISYNNYDECKNNVINCVNESHKNIKISNISTEDFVILAETDQVSIIDLQETVINGEWIKIIRSNLNVLVDSASEIQSTINFKTDESNDRGDYDWVYQFLNNTTYNNTNNNYKLYNSKVTFTSPKISATDSGGPSSSSSATMGPYLKEKIITSNCIRTTEPCHTSGWASGKKKICGMSIVSAPPYKEIEIPLYYKFTFNGNYIFKTIPERFENYYYFKPNNKISSVINLNTLKNKKIYILADSQTDIKVDDGVLASSQTDDVEIKLNIDYDDLNNFYQKRKNVWGKQTSTGTGFCVGKAHGDINNFPLWRTKYVTNNNNDIFNREISLDNTAISKLKEKTKTALIEKEKTLKIYKI